MLASQIEQGLGRWAETRGGSATLINVSENHTYRIDTPGGRYILRLHRAGYQSRPAIESELAWIAAIGDRLPVPRPLPGCDGTLLQQLGNGRTAVLFAHERGTEPEEDADLAPLFRVLGNYAADLHEQALTWRRPSWFERPVWTAESILDRDGLWGDWRAAPGVEGRVAAALHGLDADLRHRLEAFGTGPDRYGLIHADMRLANVLVDGNHVTLIDFDDSGFCWHLYDLAASLSFIETRPDLEDLIEAWCGAYRSRRALPADHLELIRPMILLRRMALLAWIGSHGETDLARRHAPRFAVDTADLARRLLS